MSLFKRISNFINGLAVQKAPLTPNETVTNTSQKTADTVRTARPTGRPKAKVDWSEALRLHLQGVSYRKIARKMDVPLSTLHDYLSKFEPAQQTAPDAVQAQPDMPARAMPLPLATAAVQMPVQTPELTQQAPVHSQGGSAVTEPYAEPLDNAAELCRRSEWFATQSAWRQEPFFLVNDINPLNLQFCTNNSQHCVAIAQWDESYRESAVFQDAAKVWVVLSPDDDNAVFLGSIISDIWVRERCLVARVDSILDIAKWKADHCVGRWVGSHGIKTSFETFEQVFKFQPMPSPNHTAVIAKLLEKPPAKPAQFSQPSFGGLEPWMSGGSGYAPPSDWKPKLPPGGTDNDGSGFCF